MGWCKKYPHLVSDIQAVVSKPPTHKSKWTIEEIANELRKQNYNISRQANKSPSDYLLTAPVRHSFCPILAS